MDVICVPKPLAVLNKSKALEEESSLADTFESNDPVAHEAEHAVELECHAEAIPMKSSDVV